MGEVEVEEVVLPLDPVSEDADAGPEAEGEEAEEEAEVPRKAREPSEPTDEERKRHETTHLPFRNWCPYCVKGRMANPPHQDLGPAGPRGVPEVAMDYCFLSKEEGSKSLTVLVAKDRDFKRGPSPTRSSARAGLSRTRLSRLSSMSGGSGIWGR